MTELNIDLTDYFTPYQLAWIRDESPLKIGEKSRRIGWTYATSFRRVMVALREKCDTWWSTRDLETAKEAIRYCSQWAAVAEAVVELSAQEIQYSVNEDGQEVVKKTTAQVLTFANGSRIYALSSNPDALAGKGGHVVLDEFALHEYQAKLWQVAQPTASVWGYQIEVFSTHRARTTKFNQFIVEAKGGNRMGWSLHSVSIYDAVEDGLVDRINRAVAKRHNLTYEAAKAAKPDWWQTGESFLEKQRRSCDSEADWEQEYNLNPQDSKGAHLTLSEIDRARRPEADLLSMVIPSAGLFLSLDVARTRDLAVFYLVANLGDKLVEVCREEHQNVKISVLRERFIELFRQHKCAAGIIDGTGLGRGTAEEANDIIGGDRVYCMIYLNASKSEMADSIKSAFEDNRILISDDPELRDDLHSVERGVSKTGKKTYHARRTVDGHADRFWALAQCLWLIDNEDALPTGAMRAISKIKSGVQRLMGGSGRSNGRGMFDGLGSSSFFNALKAPLEWSSNVYKTSP